MLVEKIANTDVTEEKQSATDFRKYCDRVPPFVSVSSVLALFSRR